MTHVLKPYNAAFFYNMASDQMRVYSNLWKGRSETECLPIQAFSDIRTKLQDFIAVLERINNKRKIEMTAKEREEEEDYIGFQLSVEIARLREENGL